MAAFMVAAVAAIGNMLQGWDGGAIAGMDIRKGWIVLELIFDRENGFELHQSNVSHLKYTSFI